MKKKKEYWWKNPLMRPLVTAVSKLKVFVLFRKVDICKTSKQKCYFGDQAHKHIRNFSGFFKGHATRIIVY